MKVGVNSKVAGSGDCRSQVRQISSDSLKLLNAELLTKGRVVWLIEAA